MSFCSELLKDADEILRRRVEVEKYECQVRRLSDLIREEGVERIDLLKVDVQRAEMDVLRGLEEEDWGKIEQIVKTTVFQRAVRKSGS